MFPTSRDLVPASAAPKYDSAADPVMEALRSELRALLDKPFSQRSISTAIELLTYADGIFVLRRGAVGKKRGRKGVLNSIAVSNPNYYMGASDYGDDDGPIASAPNTETMGTHAMRELMGVLTKATEKTPPAPEKIASDRATSISAISFALKNAQALPEDIRGAVEKKLRADLDIVLNAEIIESEPPVTGPEQAMAAGVATSLIRAIEQNPEGLGPAFDAALGGAQSDGGDDADETNDAEAAE